MRAVQWFNEMPESPTRAALAHLVFATALQSQLDQWVLWAAHNVADLSSPLIATAASLVEVAADERGELPASDWRGAWGPSHPHDWSGDVLLRGLRARSLPPPAELAELFALLHAIGACADAGLAYDLRPLFPGGDRAPRLGFLHAVAGCLGPESALTTAAAMGLGEAFCAALLAAALRVGDDAAAGSFAAALAGAPELADTLDAAAWSRVGAVVQAACVDSRPEHTLVLCALDQEALDGYLAAPAAAETHEYVAKVGWVSALEGLAALLGAGFASSAGLAADARFDAHRSAVAALLRAFNPR